MILSRATAFIQRSQSTRLVGSRRAQVWDVVGVVLQSVGGLAAFDILLVWNDSNCRNLNAPARYFAQLSSAIVSRKVRDAFSTFFCQVNPVPQSSALTQISIQNKVTLASWLRLAILHQLGLTNKEKILGSSFSVKGFEASPVLTIVPLLVLRILDSAV